MNFHRFIRRRSVFCNLSEHGMTAFFQNSLKLGKHFGPTQTSPTNGRFPPAASFYWQPCVFETSKPKTFMVIIFVLKKFIHTGTLLTDCYIWVHLHFVYGNVNGFTTNNQAWLTKKQFCLWLNQFQGHLSGICHFLLLLFWKSCKCPMVEFKKGCKCPTPSQHESYIFQ